MSSVDVRADTAAPTMCRAIHRGNSAIPVFEATYDHIVVDNLDWEHVERLNTIAGFALDDLHDLIRKRSQAR